MIRFFKVPLEHVLNSEGVQLELDRHAATVERRVRDDLRTSPGVRVFRRHGKSRRGAFAQVVMVDDEHPSGATVIEFGTESQGPRAPLRRALR